MRALGLDLGSKRIGIAVSDPDGRLATPADVLHRTGDRTRDHRAVADLVAEWEVEVVVVGVPYSLDGGTGPAAEAMLAESRQLARFLDVPVETHDERLTTVSAERRLSEAGLDARAQRKVVDQMAAAVLLQAWLDARSGEATS
ncbi:MAG TPA: Holliday junction resolvase RuvX [Acidimicrobiales bacterium]|nr:Holliday junction resolvase RuvX [Actinomycetes bacterium]MDP6104959.1 Holliday junction resolvase RuvX [Acidimicrobiales bacterium]MCP4845986.1 Holliday junction resolvase RuvX [Actinomycetes bacterium]MDP6240997.1 Holliday junction resolvase RuvX [Acidimicrobiales bacterium]MDP7125452.1 Holliday junction resolvase RuvX [Acidimicrobiales bacterium]